MIIIHLIKYCDHNRLQAEQCALLVHTNGKCSIKKDIYEKLKPIHEALLDAGLNSMIE